MAGPPAFVHSNSERSMHGEGSLSGRHRGSSVSPDWGSSEIDLFIESVSIERREHHVIEFHRHRNGARVLRIGRLLLPPVRHTVSCLPLGLTPLWIGSQPSNGLCDHRKACGARSPP